MPWRRGAGCGGPGGRARRGRCNHHVIPHKIGVPKMSEEQGLSLLDIGPQSEMVPVGEEKLNVYGVSAKGIFSLLTRFPQLRTWFAGQAGQKLDIGQLVAELPDGIAAIIAAGCGLPGNPAAEEAAAAMAVESQLDILEAI